MNLDINLYECFNNDLVSTINNGVELTWSSVIPTKSHKYINNTINIDFTAIKDTLTLNGEITITHNSPSVLPYSLSNKQLVKVDASAGNCVLTLPDYTLPNNIGSFYYIEVVNVNIITPFTIIVNTFEMKYM